MRLALIAGVILATPAQADNEALRLGNIAANCLTLGVDEQNNLADFEVVIGDDGKVSDITVTHYEPKNEAGRDFVRRASAAIEKCVPTYEVEPGRRRFHVNGRDDYETDPPKVLIDPFKG